MLFRSIALITIDYSTGSILIDNTDGESMFRVEDFLSDDWIIAYTNLDKMAKHLFTDLEIKSFFKQDISKEKKSEPEVKIIPNERFLCGNCNVIFDGIVALDKKDNKYICPYCGYDIFTQLCTLRISKEGI